jgi:hypothetical protein
MCNYLHEIHEKISEEGKGFKIFGKDGSPLFNFLNVPRTHYELSDDEWVVWNSEHRNEPEAGFCIFLTKEIAEECFRLLEKYIYGSQKYKHCYISPIEYKQGLGKHMEHQLTEGEHEIAIVKQFRIVKE